MCRLFASISTTPQTVERPLVDGPRSLLAQSQVDPKRLQGDGWGIGGFARGQPVIFKSSRPMYEELRGSAVAGRRGVPFLKRSRPRPPATSDPRRSHVWVGHVRWASNPLKLPKHELIGLAHTQPFTSGRWIFAHNGTLYIPKEVASALQPKWRRRIRGRNDSEVLFYWLMQCLTEKKLLTSSRRTPGSRTSRHWAPASAGVTVSEAGIQQLAKAVRQAIQGLDKIWASCRKRYPIYKFGYHGLNWVLTDGNVLMACCYVNPKGWDRNKALCSDAPYFQLNYRASDKDVCVASEPLDNDPGWKTMRHGELLVARGGGKGIIVDRTKAL